MKYSSRFISTALSLVVLLVSIPPLSGFAANEQHYTLENIRTLQTYLLDEDYVVDKSFDYNGDGCLNAVDLTLVKRDIMTTGTLEPTNFSSNVWEIYLNTEEQVTFTVEIKQSFSLDTYEVGLYDSDDSLVAQMYDDGTNGDVTANDGIYTAITTLSSSDICIEHYYAAAEGFKSNTHEIVFYRDLTEEEINGFSELQGTLEAMSFEEAISYIKQSDEITEYSIDTENSSFGYRTVYNITGIWDQTECDSETDTNWEKPEVPEQQTQHIMVPAHSDKKDVIVLEPYASSKKITTSVIETLGLGISSALGGNLTVVKDDDVTLEHMQQLQNYGSVLIKTHGTKSIFGNPYIILGNINLNNVANPADIIGGRVMLHGLRYAVGGNFFDKYYGENELNNSLWVFDSCYGMCNNHLADVLMNKGAGAVIGFSDSVNQKYSDDILYNTIDKYMLSNGETISQAVKHSKIEKGSYDPDSPHAEIRYKGSSFRLVSLTSIDQSAICKNYVGTYVATQGITGLDLTVMPYSYPSTVRADFSFYAVPDNPNVPSGRFWMEGVIDSIQDDGSILINFTAVDWYENEHPDNWHMIEFDALINPSSGLLTSQSYKTNLQSVDKESV